MLNGSWDSPLGAHRIPSRDHCNLTELSQNGRFVTIMSDVSPPLNLAFWLKSIINDRFLIFFYKQWSLKKISNQILIGAYV